MHVGAGTALAAALGTIPQHVQGPESGGHVHPLLIPYTPRSSSSTLGSWQEWGHFRDGSGPLETLTSRLGVLALSHLLSTGQTVQKSE